MAAGQNGSDAVKSILRDFLLKVQNPPPEAVERKLNGVERPRGIEKGDEEDMTTILIRKGLNGFRYCACGEKGNFLFNASQISAITRHWSVEHRNGTVQFIRQLDKYPEQELADPAKEKDTVCSRMKEARLAKGYTQRQCAQLLEIQTPSYAAMENGRTHIPKHMLVCLAIRLRVNTKWLLTGTGKMKIGGESEYVQE